MKINRKARLWIAGIILAVLAMLYLIFIPDYWYNRSELLRHRLIYFILVVVYLCMFKKIKEWLIKYTDLILKWAVIVLIIYIICGGTGNTNRHRSLPPGAGLKAYME